MNILLTGATGFIGSNLLLHIPEDCRCYALVRPTTDISHLQCADIHVFDGDVDALASFLREKKISGILHLASLYLSSHRSEDVAPLVSSNVTFGASVLEAAAKSDAVIVGSAVVKRLMDGRFAEAMALIRAMRKALDAAYGKDA